MQPDHRATDPSRIRAARRILARTVLGLSVLFVAACSDDADGSSSSTNATSGATDGTTGSTNATSTGATTASTTTGNTDSATATSAGTGSTSGSDTGTSDTGSTGTPTGSSGTTGGAGSLELLLVGNSYTAGNNLAALIEDLGASLGWSITTQAFTPGGALFSDHLANSSVTDAIASGAFDFVTLQGQSYETIHPALEADAYTSGVALAGLVTDAGMEPVFFETWAREAGHPDYANAWSGGDPASWAALTHAAYTTIATDAGASLAPVGQAFMDVVSKDPAINLYSGDGSHRSIHGSYLAACVFFSVLTGETPVGATNYPGAISADEALILQEAAELATAP